MTRNHPIFQFPTVVLAGSLVIGAAVGCNQHPSATGSQGTESPENHANVPDPSAHPDITGPIKTPPLNDDLSDIARMIGQNRSGPARVRLVKHEKTNPDDAAATAFLFGLSYHRERLYGQARPYFEKSIHLDPRYPPAHYFYGWCLYYIGEDIDLARTSFLRHAVMEPDSADTHFALGLIALDEDRLEDAERRFHTAIELEQGDPRRTRDVAKAHTRLADVAIRRDQWETARAQLAIATALYPDHYESHFKMYRVLERLGETEAAERAHQAYLAARRRVPPGSRQPGG